MMNAPPPQGRPPGAANPGSVNTGVVPPPRTASAPNDLSRVGAGVKPATKSSPNLYPPGPGPMYHQGGNLYPQSAMHQQHHHPSHMPSPHQHSHYHQHHQQHMVPHQPHHHNQHHHQYHHHHQPPPNQYPPSAHHVHHSHHHGQPHHQHHQGTHLQQHPQHIVHQHQHHHHGHHQQPFHPPHQQGPPQHHYNHNAAPFYVPGQEQNVYGGYIPGPPTPPYMNPQPRVQVSRAKVVITDASGLVVDAKSGRALADGATTPTSTPATSTLAPTEGAYQETATPPSESGEPVSPALAISVTKSATPKVSPKASPKPKAASPKAKPKVSPKTSPKKSPPPPAREPTPEPPARVPSPQEEPAIEVLGPLKLTFDVMRKFRDNWNPRHMPEADTVKAVVQELLRLNDKDNQVRLRTPKSDDRPMFGTDVTMCVDVRDVFANKVDNPFSHRSKAEGAEVEELKKLVTRILNRVSDKNYDALLQELLNSNMDSVCQQPEVLRDTVAMFFSKAVNEKIYANVYGRLCKDICHHWAQLATETGSAPSTPTLEVTQTFCSKFRRQLLNQCQEEFERGIKLQKELELLPPAEKEIQEGKLRNRTLANMKFVGELYKHNLITERIMHQVMFLLLFPSSSNDQMTDEGLELFCELMDTVGKQLDRPKAQQYMQQYFQKVTLLSTSYKTSRVRFKLQNLLDLRRNNWVREDGPNTPTVSHEQGGKPQTSQPPPVKERPREPEPVLPKKAVMARPAERSAPTSNAYHAPTRQQQAPVAVHRDPAPAVVAAPVPAAPVVVAPAEVKGRTALSMKNFTAKEWEEKIKIMFQEDAQEDSSDSLKLYDEASRAQFFSKSLQLLCGSVKYSNSRRRFGIVVKECQKAKLMNAATLDLIIDDVVKDWIEQDTVADTPRLWDCWAELVVSGIQAEVLTEGILNKALDRMLTDTAPDPDAVVFYVKAVHGVLSRSGVASGTTSYLRTMSAAKYPDVLKALLAGDTQEPALLMLATLQQRSAVVLDDVKDITAVSRCAGVLCTQAYLEVREASDITRVFKKLKDHFTKVVDAKSVKERAPKELAILSEAHQSWKAFGKADAYMQDLITVLLANQTVSNESVKISKISLAGGNLLMPPTPTPTPAK